MISNLEKKSSFVLRLTALGLTVALAACSSAESAPPSDDDDSDATEATVGAAPGPDETPLTSDDLVDTPDEVVPATTTRAADGYVLVPGGREVHESCIVQIDDDDVVDDDAGTVTHPDGTVDRIAVCDHPVRLAPAAAKPSADVTPAASGLSDGWQTAGEGDPKYPVSKYWAYWRVPAAPKKSSNQTIFFFNGTQDSVSTANEILQPVLQWGGSYAGGGAYWSIASWHVFGNHAAVSRLKRVHAGDLIWGFGKVSKGGKWQIVTYDTKTGASTTGHFVTHRPQKQALGGVMEMYDVGSCDELPRAHYVVFQTQSWYHGNEQGMDPHFFYNRYGSKSACGGIHAYKGAHGNVGIRF